MADNLSKQTQKLLQAFGSRQGGVDGSVRVEEFKGAAYDGSNARNALLERARARGGAGEDFGAQTGAFL